MAHLIVYLSGCLVLAFGGITSRDLVYITAGALLLQLTQIVLDKYGLE